jgi:hypothetical protein
MLRDNDAWQVSRQLDQYLLQSRNTARGST